MQTIVDREYVRGHAGEVIRSFGLMAYIRSLRTKDKGLLEQLEEKYLSSGVPMPGRLGNAYRLSALIELRVARIYERMVRRFDENPLVSAFFQKLQEEEQEHARVMVLCLYTVDAQTELDYVPSVRDPEMRALLGELRAKALGVWKLSLDEALDLTEKLEASEVNTIFDKLLKQTRNPKSDFFISQLAKVEGHASAVPKRIKALREQLA
jgi:rubrerythrin